MRCPNCGLPSMAKDVYCSSCGHLLSFFTSPTRRLTSPPTRPLAASNEQPTPKQTQATSVTRGRSTVFMIAILIAAAMLSSMFHTALPFSPSFPPQHAFRSGPAQLNVHHEQMPGELMPLIIPHRPAPFLTPFEQRQTTPQHGRGKAAPKHLFPPGQGRSFKLW